MAQKLLGRRDDQDCLGRSLDEESISALDRRKGIAESPYYSWSKEILEAGSRRFLEPIVHPTSRPRRPIILKTNARIMSAPRRITRRPKAKSSDGTRP